MRILLTLIICLSSLSMAPVLNAQSDTDRIGDYLDLLASRITADQSPMASAESWKTGEPARRTRLMRMLGLDPLPERSPLNPQYVGDAVELEACTFRRVVFESAPGVFVAAHVYLPKGVRFPAPAVIYVPGHSRRDKYVPHPLAYASKGYVAVGLPMVGEEGRIEDDTGKCGHYGPFHEHFDWYADGYTSAGVEVWDTMRTIDFLLTLKDAKGGSIVDPARIGLAGLSGGSARTFWAAAADPRIAAAVACQGFTTISNYDQTIPSTCDVHLFYNYYQQSYAEVYGNVAPRALRVIQATEDPLYKNPQPVADGLTRIYKVQGKADRFSYVTFPGGHGYTPDVVAREEAWFDQWLKPETPVLPALSDAERSVFKANRARLNDPKELQCFTGSRAGWKLNGKPLKAIGLRTHFSPKFSLPDIQDEPALRAMRKNVMQQLKEEVLRHAFQETPAELKLDQRRREQGLQVSDGVLLIDNTLKRACRMVMAPRKTEKTLVLLVEGKVEDHKDPAYALARSGKNVLILELTRLTDKHMHRYAALVGHTQTSLRINEALAAVRTLRLPSGSISLQGKGPAAVVALFAAIIDSDIAGVILEDCPAQFNPETALLGIRRHTEILQAAALLFPRSLTLAGGVDNAFAWTAKVYERLGEKDAVIGITPNAK